MGIFKAYSQKPALIVLVLFGVITFILGYQIATSKRRSSAVLPAGEQPSQVPAMDFPQQEIVPSPETQQTQIEASQPSLAGPEQVFIPTPLPQPKVPSYAPVQSSGNLKAEFPYRRSDFYTILNVFIQEGTQLQSNIDELYRVAEYYRQKADQGDGSLSLEESLVYETRYRDFLNTMIQTEHKLLAIFNKMVSHCRGYIDYLEKAIQEQ